MRTLLRILPIALFLLASYRVCAAEEPNAIKITTAENHLDVTIGGKPFTSYWFGQHGDQPYVRPFFYPVYAPGDVEVTSDQYSRKQKEPKTDHPHHQSLWVAHGDVNGVDHWSLGKDGKGDHSAQQRHIKFEKAGDDRFVEELVWDDNDKKPLLNEVRTVQFIAYPDGSRGVDVTSVFAPAGEGPVTFGDTKEAGMLAVRLAPQISAHPTITQSTGKGGEGAAGEKQTWGKAADWCDESGEIDGKPFGVAIFDAPANPRHPARWHVRAYGLLAANIFGLSEYNKKNPKHAGDLVVEKGNTITFRHQAVIHAGSAADAKLDEKYKQFSGE